MRSLKFSKQNIESNSLPITDMEEPKLTRKYQDLLENKYGKKNKKCKGVDFQMAKRLIRLDIINGNPRSFVAAPN